ncbi:MAG: GNAT family N-acetyltransferase [Clostridiales bacterium]|nr:GNAT family N-acetyltransferase [Clostridiales bacterium]
MHHLGTCLLETDRLLLRRFLPQDADSVYREWASDPEVTKYLTWPAHQSPDVSRAFVDWCVGRYGDPACYCWVIVWKETLTPIGNISAVKYEEEISAVELGWALGRAWWGRGIMTEAARAVIAFFLDRVGANRVCAGHDVRNLRSGRVMQKAGMAFEGVHRAAGRNNQGVVDMAVYAILQGDSREAKPDFFPQSP